VHMHSAAAAQHKGVLFNILPTKRFSMILSSPGIAATPETDTVAPFVQRIEHESYMSAGVSVPLPAAATAAAEPAPGKRRSVSGAPQV
jgi:nucleoid-associated protein YgaU